MTQIYKKLAETALRELAKKLITELAGSVKTMTQMTGAHSFTVLPPDFPDVGGVGGVSFKISGRLCKNKANYVRIYAFADGHREIYFFRVLANKLKYLSAFFAATPADLPRVWYEATACATKMPRVFDSSRVKFEAGRILTTQGAKTEFAEDFLRRSIARHLAGDWGDVCPADAAANDEALQCGDRIISTYNYNGSKLFIITEADRSATTCLLPSEY